MTETNWRCVEEAMFRTSKDQNTQFSDEEVQELAKALRDRHTERSKLGDDSTLSFFQQLPTKLRERILARFQPRLDEVCGSIQDLTHLKNALERYGRGSGNDEV